MRPLDLYMVDDAVREIAIPRPGELFLKKQGRWHFHTEPKLTLDFLQALISAIASYNTAHFGPIMSLRMPDGERVQVGQPPAVVEGTVSVNIRKHSSVVKTLDELDEEGAFTSWKNLSPPIRDSAILTDQDRELLELLNSGRMKDFLHMAVQYCRNMIIGGKTGSGKTTFARSLIERVPTGERAITIEDVHELYLPNHPNRVHMIYGPGQGHISATDCIAACMRSSPDRIFLSELRGPEAWDYLNALNTGHPGSVTTTHANSARDTFDRVALLVKQSPAGQQIDVQTLRQFLYSTLDISLYFASYKLAEVYFNPARMP
jgi:type IV secretion system protein VirB11